VIRLAAALLLAAANPQERAGAVRPPEVRFDVRDLSGQGARALPVTLSALLERGRFRDDDVAVVVRAGADGAPAIVPAQLDVLSRHEDGSLQHALVTVPVDLAPRATNELFLVPSPSPPRKGDLPEPPPGAEGEAGADAPPVVVELVDEKNAHFTTLLVAPPRNVRPEGRAAGPVFGPLAQEVEVVARLKSAAGDLPNVEVRARWRRLAGVGGARVEVAVENVPPPRKGGQGPPPDDVSFARLAVIAGETVLCDLKNGVLHDRTRFVVRRFVGAAAAPPRLMIRQDLASLVRGGWLPPIDASHPLPDVTAGELARRAIDSDQNGDVRAADFELGIPLDPGPIARYMPATGDRGDIGAIPSWAVIALNSRSAIAEDALLAADVCGSASFPIHVRAADGTMGLEHGPAAPLEKRETRLKCPRTPDRAHAPLLGAPTFLLTGDRCAEEEFAAWAAYCLYDWPHDGKYRYPGSRDFAWSLRTTMLAAKLLPDDHPLKPYFRERVTANLADLRAILEKSEAPLHTWGSGGWQASGRKSWPCATQWSAWQASWVAATLWWTDRLLGNADARALYEWQAQYFTRAYSSVGKTWNAPDGTLVKWTSGHDALAYSFPVATYEPMFVDGEWKPKPESRRFIESFPEALWWLRVNLDHEFDPGKPPDLPMGPDGVPSLPPEQWRPKRGWIPPPHPGDYWIAYSMEWLAAVLEADDANLRAKGIEGGHAVWAAVSPIVATEIKLPGLRMAPDLIR
jgi:hypothetical protein